MAITRYAGNRMTGTNTDRTGLSTTNLLNTTIFTETDTQDMYHWNGSAWQLISGNSVAETLTNKTISGSDNTLSNIANSSLTGPVVAVTDGTTSTNISPGGTITFSNVANETTVAQSGGTITVGLPDNVTITGNLTVNGSTTTVNSTTVTLDDPVLVLGGDTAPASDDNKDRGVMFRWYSGSAKVGFFGHDDSTGRFTYIPDGSVSSEVASGTKGDIDINDVFAVNSTFTGTGQFDGVLTATNQVVIDNANKNYTPAVDGLLFHTDALTLTDNSTAASGTAAQDFMLWTVDQPTVAATNTSVTTTNASTVYIAAAPTAGTNMTLTNAYALNVAAGAVRMGGTLTVDGASTLTGAITASGAVTVAGLATFNGSVDIGDASSDTVTITADVDSNILPSADDTYDLGASASQWKDIYIDGTGYIDAIATGSNITSPNIITAINDTNGLELFVLSATASAVNEITVANAATGGNPSLKASGGDTNVSFTLSGKGTGGMILTNATANGAFLEFDTKAAPSDPAAESARMYLKQVDAANNAIAVKIQKAGAIQEVEITSPKAVCGVCGRKDGATDPTYDFERSMMTVELWCGHSYEVPMANWSRVA